MRGDHVNGPPAGLPRRLAAVLYDSLLLFGVLFIAGLPLPLLPDGVRDAWWCKLAVQFYLLAVCFVFFGWFWMHGGQTLGMRAWRLRLVAIDPRHTIRWSQVLRRFLAAILSWAVLGLGFLWVWIDRRSLAWHDRLSGTQLIVLPKPTRE